jgi:hypothetical protein
VNTAKRWSLSIGIIAWALAHLRARSAEYGWTIPHVKRGAGTDDDEGRYIALLVDRDGHYELDQNPDALMHITNGIVGTIKQTVTQMTNMSAATRIAATHTRSINARARLNDLADDFAYMARKAAAVARDLEKAA